MDCQTGQPDNQWTHRSNQRCSQGRMLAALPFRFHTFLFGFCSVRIVRRVRIVSAGFAPAFSSTVPGICRPLSHLLSPSFFLHSAFLPWRARTAVAHVEYVIAALCVVITAVPMHTSFTWMSHMLLPQWLRTSSSMISSPFPFPYWICQCSFNTPP